MARNKKSSPDSLIIQKAVDLYILNPSSKTFNYKQVSEAVGFNSPANHRAVALYLAELAFDGELVEVARGKYKVPEHKVTATGTFVRLRNGKNSVVTDGDEQTIFVAERNSMHALNGDRVQVSIAARVKGREPEAIVTEILEKKRPDLHRHPARRQAFRNPYPRLKIPCHRHHNPASKAQGRPDRRQGDSTYHRLG